MMFKPTGLKSLRWLIYASLLLGAAIPAVFGQDQPSTEESTTDDSVVVSGGVVYAPVTDDEQKLRDPFKSPFDIEREREEARRRSGRVVDEEGRLPYNISEMILGGIYLRYELGYVAIFDVNGQWKWFTAGTRFLDGDLINITDGSVTFKHYPEGKEENSREVVKVLRREE